MSSPALPLNEYLKLGQMPDGRRLAFCKPTDIPRPERLERYGLDEIAYRLLFDLQQGLCAVCCQRKIAHIDHCHLKGHVRGLLCARCNTGLGQFMDNPGVMRAAARYVETRQDSHAPYEYLPRQEDWMGVGSPYKKLGYHGKHTSDESGDFLDVYRGGEHIAEVSVIIPACLGARVQIWVKRKASGECQLFDCGTFDGDDECYLEDSDDEESASQFATVLPTPAPLKPAKKKRGRPRKRS